MAKSDYYEILGLNKNASDADIKKAYRRLAMKYHPDRNTGNKAANAEKNFKDAKEAYEILSDSQKRASYDQFGHAGVDPSMGPGQGGFGTGGNFSDIFGDVFGDIFGGGRGGGQRSNRGADLRYNLELSLEDAVFGTSVKIKVPNWVTCVSCNGSGAKKGTSPKKCGTCNGAGQVRMQQGFFSVQQPCPSCQGRGSVIDSPCPSCRSQGRVKETKTLSVKVPPGVDSGDRIRLSGEGEIGELGGPAGDLYVQIAVKKHPIFERNDSDLYCEMPISFSTAALGGETEVPTLRGRVKLKIPEGTQTGKMFRMRSKGIKPVRGGPQGDLICRVIVETPIKLTAGQKALMEEFETSLSSGEGKHSPNTRNWLDKVKGFLKDVGL